MLFPSKAKANAIARSHLASPSIKLEIYKQARQNQERQRGNLHHGLHYTKDKTGNSIRTTRINMGHKYTPSPVAVEQGMYTAYAALATMAIVPIYFGAFASLKKWKVVFLDIQ